jgi:hypothetical protein
MTANYIAQACVLDALEANERAQRQLDDAAQALSAVRGSSKKYVRIWLPVRGYSEALAWWRAGGTNSKVGSPQTTMFQRPTRSAAGGDRTMSLSGAGHRSPGERGSNANPE